MSVLVNRLNILEGKVSNLNSNNNISELEKKLNYVIEENELQKKLNNELQIELKKNVNDFETHSKITSENFKSVGLNLKNLQDIVSNLKNLQDNFKKMQDTINKLEKKINNTVSSN